MNFNRSEALQEQSNEYILGVSIHRLVHIKLSVVAHQL